MVRVLITGQVDAGQKYVDQLEQLLNEFRDYAPSTADGFLGNQLVDLVGNQRGLRDVFKKDAEWSVVSEMWASARATHREALQNNRYALLKRKIQARAGLQEQEKRDLLDRFEVRIYAVEQQAKDVETRLARDADMKLPRSQLNRRG